jgi:RNA polymerase sigma-70 factor, ECF subfamily
MWMSAPGENRTNASQKTSLSLLARLRENDEDAWKRLTHLYQPLVLYWVRRQGVQESDYDDVVQEVFHAASQSLQHFRKERPEDTFRGWLRGIVHHQVLMFFRKTGKQPLASGGTEAMLFIQNVPQQQSDPRLEEDSAVMLNDLYHRALELVRKEFEEVTWRAFWRVVVDGQQPALVAEEMGVSASAIRQAKSRILRRLKQEVGELIH